MTALNTVKNASRLLIVTLSIFNAATFSVGRTTFLTKSRQPQRTVLNSQTASSTTVEIGKEVGSGSYGTVHLCSLDGESLICKRAWDESDKILQSQDSDPKERADRCRYYFDVEKHCFEKMAKKPTDLVPRYRGTMEDSDQHEWMVFELIKRTSEESPALTLDQVMKLDWTDQHTSENHHHLYMIEKEMGLPPTDEDGLGQTLDTLLIDMLDCLIYSHSLSIVHRDFKPSNLLTVDQGLVLFDFGSAADMEPVSKNLFGKEQFVGIESENRVALSPIYSAPEVFIKPKCDPLNFDVYSVGLVFCQLLFNYLDERTDAGFHQQLIDANYDLDTWLSRELSSKVRPDGLEDAILYLGERRGLWNLLRNMLQVDPERRYSSAKAKAVLQQVLEQDANAENEDGSFFESVVTSMESCDVPLFIEDQTTPSARPLHFVATFERRLSLGLILSEANDEDVEDMDPEDLVKWREATKNALEGEVFVKEIVPYGQADQMDIFEIGDRLEGIGELPLAKGGFEKVVSMLEQQPPRAKTVKVHFDRQPSTKPQATAAAPHLVRVLQQGAWSTKGRRKTQEDNFVLHEVQNTKDESHPILVAGVFDGHAGTAASEMASQLLPTLVTDSGVHSLESAWTKTCDTYRDGCDKESDVCLAEYDSREGTLNANTGSGTAVAGTTASILTISSHEFVETMSVLNCGDSRTLVVGKSSESKKVCCWSTTDHSPSSDLEAQRLQKGRDEGLAYSLPQCSLSKWWLSVGDYQYAVSRSLEGSFATSKGIVSDADVDQVPLSQLLAERSDCCLVLATDGVFEVMDNELVGKELISKRQNGMSAGDAAKELCSLAIEKGTTDNVSVLVVYLE